MTIRTATSADLPVLEDLWRAFEREVPPPPHVEVDVEGELRELRELVGGGIALVAERDGAVVGFALGRRTSDRLGRLTDLYVVPDARRAGVASALVHEVAVRLRDSGVEWVDLEVVAGNGGARDVYRRWGFREDTIVMVASVDALAVRLADSAPPSFGSIHVQTDDRDAVERGVRQFVPRLPGRSRGSEVSEPRNGWVAVYDDVCDRDPAMLRRLARELSDRLGAVVVAFGVEEEAVVRFIVHDRGRIVDEYASVPEYHGPLPPGDVVALQANPTVVARLTGADPALVKSLARTAASAAELPPPHELLASLAAAMGIEGADRGWQGE